MRALHGEWGCGPCCMGPLKNIHIVFNPRAASMLADTVHLSSTGLRMTCGQLMGLGFRPQTLDPNPQSL